MRALGLLLVILVTAGAFVYAQTVGVQTINPLPSPGSSFQSQLTTFLRDEDAGRYRLQFGDFIVSGGVVSTGAGLTKTPSVLTAFAGGYYVTETGAITFPDGATCHVIASQDTGSSAIGTFNRVAGTHYLIDCGSGSPPAKPTTAVYLASVVTSGGAVTAVTDRRVLTPAPVGGGAVTTSTPLAVGDILYADTTSSWARLPAVVGGNVLTSIGVSTAPAWGKVGLNTAVSGTLGPGNGGTGATTVPSNGMIPTGNGSTYVAAVPIAGSGMTITPGAGTLTFSSSGSAPLGYRNMRAYPIGVNSLAVAGKLNTVTQSLVMALEIGGNMYTSAGATTITVPTSCTSAVALTGTASTTSGTASVTMSSSNTLCQGETVIVDIGGAPQQFTLLGGGTGCNAGTTFNTYQAATATVSGKTAQRGGTTSAARVPSAIYFVYAQPTQPITLYCDTAIPLVSYHPRSTTHRWTGVQVYNSASNQLDTDEFWTWHDGTTTVKMIGSKGGSYTRSSATYAFMDSTNLVRPFYFGPGATVQVTAAWQTGSSTTVTGNVAIGYSTTSTGTPSAASTLTSYVGGTANVQSQGNFTFIKDGSADDVGFYGLAFKGDGANTLSIINTTVDGTNQAPKAPFLSISVSD